MKYLGINLTKNVKCILKNKEHSWEKLKIQINGDIFWFWVRQQNIVKMSNIPKFPVGIFVEIDKLTPKFISNYKWHRIAKETLRGKKEQSWEASMAWLQGLVKIYKNGGGAR